MWRHSDLPWPPAVESYTDTLNNLRTQKENLKVFPLNAQSMRKQRLQLKKTLDDLSLNTITAITETWFNDTGEKTCRQLSKQFQFLPSDERKSFQLKGGIEKWYW